MTITQSVPGEFERQSALILGSNELIYVYPELNLEIIRALVGSIPIIALIQSEEHRRWAITQMSDWGLPAHEIQFYSVPGSSMWVRDYGPNFVKVDNGDVVMIDAAYSAKTCAPDDAFPQQLGALLRVPVINAPLTLDGGNMLSNGRGRCVTSNLLANANVARGYTLQQTGMMLRQYYGFDRWTYLPPLVREPTGHIDMFATFTAPDTIVVGSLDPAEDAQNAALLDENARVLASSSTPDSPLRVVRMPMPHHRDGRWRTYTNVIYANGTLLVPVYPDVDPEPHAIFDLYQQLLPGWRIVGIRADGLINNRGSLHCVSINIPWLEDRFDPPALPARGTRRSPTPAHA